MPQKKIKKEPEEETIVKEIRKDEIPVVEQRDGKVFLVSGLSTFGDSSRFQLKCPKCNRTSIKIGKGLEDKDLICSKCGSKMKIEGEREIAKEEPKPKDEPKPKEEPKTETKTEKTELKPSPKPKPEPKEEPKTKEEESPLLVEGKQLVVNFNSFILTLEKAKQTFVLNMMNTDTGDFQEFKFKTYKELNKILLEEIKMPQSKIDSEIMNKIKNSSKSKVEKPAKEEKTGKKTSKPSPKPKPESKAESKSKDEPKPKEDPKTATKTESKPSPKPKPEPKAESKTKVISEPKTDPKTETKVVTPTKNLAIDYMASEKGEPSIKLTNLDYTLDIEMELKNGKDILFYISSYNFHTGDVDEVADLTKDNLIKNLKIKYGLKMSMEENLKLLDALNLLSKAKLTKT